MDKKIIALLICCLPCLLHAQQAGTGNAARANARPEEPAPDPATSAWKNEAFTLIPSRHGIGGLWKTNDVHPTNYVRRGRVFGDVVVRWSGKDGSRDSLRANESSETKFQQEGNDLSVSGIRPGSKALRISEVFNTQGQKLIWTITLSNKGDQPLTIGDLALPMAYNSGGGENPTEIFEQRVVKHHFISGNNSFLFWERPTGLGPYLVMVAAPGASLEYFSTNIPGEGRGAFQAYIHSAFVAASEKRGSWRQPHSSLELAAGGTRSYSFVYRWAKDYEEIRQILVEEGLIDVRAMPGMTVPNDVDAEIALRTHQPITAIVPEFPQSTTVQTIAGRQAGTHLYKIKFAHLGENRLTVNYGKGYKTYLEFFVTEPLEILYKKRAAFIVNRQQHKDPSKWYDGLFGVYDMKNHVLRGPDNPDYFDTSRLSYVLTCDDPGLCKAPFVAAKNVYYPDQQEIDGVEYYIQHFVWGKLQRTDQETPYPYGVYGTPSWKVNRDAEARRASRKDTTGASKFRMHVWRSYDYPHIMMMYYSMYQIAKLYPGKTHYLDAKGYLERARETAKAFFKYPYEILPWYETYKWGCYNELLLTDLMADLDKEGFHEDAQFLRSEWEKKVKYFLYDDPYPFRSEYAIDATAFESSHALAKYAMLNTLQPDSNLWYDKNLKRWYSHPVIKKEDAAVFMDRQMEANIALRGSVEPAYYYLGSDMRGKSDSYLLSYMSQMGGWSILDYALHFSKKPDQYIGLGYAAYLSSFALINSGTAASNYGFWYPGKDNDGASGWAFEPQQYANTWIQKAQGRGPWFYDGEIDLGFGGATRAAATIVTDDPVFGLVAYGGHLIGTGSAVSVIPLDGLRQRFYYRRKDQQVDIELKRDGFLKDKPVVFGPSCSTITLSIENRSGDRHELPISIKGLQGNYKITTGVGQPISKLFDGGSTDLSIPIGSNGTTTIHLTRS